MTEPIQTRALFEIDVDLEAPPALTGPGPQGARIIVEARRGRFQGERLRGTVRGPGGDWVTVRADGSVKLDVRLVLETHDGATILMTYNGIGIPRDDGKLSLRTAPLFETGDDRYTWLNRIQAVANGVGDTESVTYTVHEVL